MINELLKHSSVAVVGMGKNVGKTVTLNYLLSRLSQRRECVAVTSIGLDGEGLDQVTETPKPEITLYPGMLFTTAEQQYASRRLTAEILTVGGRRTSVGRLVTARVVVRGQTIITGPADTGSLKLLLQQYKQLGADLALVDGALSRVSLASPMVTDGMVLATGAAVSPNMGLVVSRTRYVCRLVELPEAPEEIRTALENKQKGIYTITTENTAELTEIKSALAGDIPHIDSRVKAVYVSGAVGDRFVERLMMQRREIELVVTDFTRIFLTEPCFVRLSRSKVKLSVLYASSLVAVTANPWSPAGYTMPSRELTERLAEAIGRPVYDVMNL